MKIRSGFVTNSSSSSFVIVGIDRWKDENLFNQICEKLGKLDKDWEFDCGREVVDALVFYGSDWEPNYCGIDAEELLVENKTVSQIKDIFMATLKGMGIENILLEKIVGLHYGECGNG